MTLHILFPWANRFAQEMTQPKNQNPFDYETTLQPGSKAKNNDFLSLKIKGNSKIVINCFKLLLKRSIHLILLEFNERYLEFNMGI